STWASGKQHGQFVVAEEGEEFTTEKPTAFLFGGVKDVQQQAAGEKTGRTEHLDEGAGARSKGLPGGEPGATAREVHDAGLKTDAAGRGGQAAIHGASGLKARVAAHLLRRRRGGHVQKGDIVLSHDRPTGERTGQGTREASVAAAGSAQEHMVPTPGTHHFRLQSRGRQIINE